MRDYIKYKQRASYDCFLAATSTVLQKFYETTWTPEFCDHVNKKQGTYGDDIDLGFQMAGLKKDQYRRIAIPESWAGTVYLMPLFQGRRALFQVPSLNNKGAKHMVVWMYDELFDPSNLQVYQWIQQLKIEHAWVFDESSVPQNGMTKSTNYQLSGEVHGE